MPEEPSPSRELDARDEDALARLVELERQASELRELLRQKESALEASERRYRRLADATTDYIYSARIEDGRVVETRHGPGCVAVTGYHSEEFSADPYLWYRMVAEEDRPSVDAHLRELLQGELSAIEHRIVRKDGQIRWVRNTPVIERDTAGRVLSYDGLVRDVTDRRLAEEALRASEQRYRQLFDAGGDAIYVHELRPGGIPGLFLEANDTACRSLGYRREELLGMGPKDINAPWDPASIAPIFARFATGEPATFERTHLTRDGRHIQVEIHARPFEFRGTPAIIALVRDISERKKAERALRLTRFAVEHASDACQWITRDARFSYVNEAASRMLGYTREELLQMSVHDIDPDIVEADWDTRWQEFGATDSVAFEARHRAKDGRVFPVEVQGNYLEFEGERLLCSYVRDISARERTSRALRESEEKFRALVENNPDVVARFDDEYRLLYVNPAFETTLGIAARDAVGQTYRECSGSTEAADWLESHVRLVFETGQEQTFETSLMTPIGVRHYLSRGVPEFAADGSVASALFIHRDISDRKRTEEALREHEARLRAVVGNSEALIFQLDTNGVFLLCEGRALAPLGLTPGAVVGQSVFQVFAGSQPMLQGVRRALLGETAYYTTCIGDMTFDTTASPVLDALGRVSSVVGIATDVTARRRAEEEQEKLRAQLIQAQKMEAMGRLAGGVAHDFNNLLTGILGFSELALLDLDPDSEAGQCLLSLNDVVGQCKELTQQILAFSRQQVLTMTIVDVNAVILSAGKMLRRIIGEHIEVRIHLEPDIGRVRADSSQLHQILLNLAVNAKDAMPQGGVLTISTARAVFSEDDVKGAPEIAPGDYVLLMVSDVGVGMDSETLSRVFEPFFTTKQLGRGTGLGLATVYGIVKQHGGLIEVQSAAGAGTAFRIFLPQVEEDSTEEDGDPARLTVSRGRETVLVVEDDVLVRDLTMRRLSNCGYEVLVAPGPLQALALVRQHTGPLDIVITDMVMPDMNGRQLYAELCKLRPGLRVLFMSGYPGDTLAQHGGALDEGLHFVQKPFTVADLTRHIRHVLDGRT
ncbi:MAG: PAS domain S-box protein [Polyangiaceae bacterium]|nr:PAS domain S-box protein [Polyangiaceae bacterium]